MAAKKRPKRAKKPITGYKASAKKRSKAAKKGWETRRRHRTENIATAIQKKAAEIADPRILSMSREELIERLKKAETELGVLRMTATWVPYHDAEQLHLGRRGNQAFPRGSIALVPSRARLLPASQLDVIMRRMRKANREGELDETIRDIADEIELPIKEVYTLWFSP